MSISERLILLQLDANFSFTPVFHPEKGLRKMRSAASRACLLAKRTWSAVAFSVALRSWCCATASSVARSSRSRSFRMAPHAGAESRNDALYLRYAVAARRQDLLQCSAFVRRERRGPRGSARG